MSLAKAIHDARRPLNNISMQAELIKMLSEAAAHQGELTKQEQAQNHAQIQAAANKILDYCQQCSAQLQAINDDASDA